MNGTKYLADTNAVIYLDKDGDGSKIGPLKVGVDDANKFLTFGNTVQVFSFKSPNTYSQSLGTRTSTETTIDYHTFDYNEINKSIQYTLPGNPAIDSGSIPSGVVDDDDIVYPIDPEGPKNDWGL